MNLIIIFIGGFIVQYFFMPAITVNGLSNVTNNIGKAYLASLLGLFMATIEVFIHDRRYHTISYKIYAVLCSLIVAFIYLYRKQIAIKDKQYLEAMIEHHSNSVFMSEEILKKTDNYNVAKIAKNIIQVQKDEMKNMIELTKK